MRWRELQWRNWPLRRKSAAAVAIPMLLLLSALVFSYRQQQVISAADADVRRALAIKNEIQSLNASIAQAAMAVRGFLLTGRDEFLAPYRLARAELPDTMRKLHESIRDPVVLAHFERISALLERKLLSLEVLREHGRSWPADDLQAHLVESKAVLDKLRDEIRTMNERETNLVAQYSAAAREAVRRNLWIDLAISTCVVIGGIAAYLMLFSGVVQRVTRLAVNAERLTQDEPLEALPPARDELGVLAERLQNASALLAARASEARSASQAKTRFLSRTSHELRTPLNAILGFAQILETDLRRSPHAGHVDQILSAGRHLLALIDDILDIARIESGEMRIALEPLSLAPLLDESCELIAPMASERRVQLHLDRAASDVLVQADRRRLRQVLLNLLSNAVKYNRSGGEVRVSTEAGDGFVEISIADTGSGIAAADLARLFTPFERLDAERAGIEGTGLGLAVSQQIVRGMGGDIGVNSQPGQGSVFTVRLLRAVGDVRKMSVAGTEPTAQAPAPAGTAQRLLVIEDNPSNLALMRALVARRPHWQLIVAGDGATGLECARSQTPTLIVLDLHLPDLGGEAVMAALKRDPALRDIPVVIVSADTLPETAARLRAAGARDYLTKPIDVVRFLAALDGASS